LEFIPQVIKLNVPKTKCVWGVMTFKEDLVAYCGLYCGDCFNYKGEIADLARDLRKELRKTKFDIV